MTSLEFHKLTEDDVALVSFVNREVSSAHWRTGPNDVECYLLFSVPGIYIAKLDGVPIGCVCFTQYSDDYYTFGFYIVNEQYRGKGYGLKMFETIKKKVDWSQNISCYAVPEMVNKYKRFGFQPQFLCAMHTLELSATLKILKTLSLPQDLEAKDPKDVNQDELLSYDSNVFGYQRHALVLKWIFNKHHHSKVVVNNKGDIVGYATTRIMCNKHDGFSIAPLFADSIQAAYVLLEALFEKIKTEGGSSSETFSIHCPVSVNAKSKDLIDALQGCPSPRSDLLFASSKGLPNGCSNKWFGIQPSG